jgi:hypothetical protein
LTFVLAQAAVNNNSNSMTPRATFAVAPTQGNLLLAFVVGTTGNWNPNTAAGWDMIATQINGDKGSIVYKIAGAAEPVLQQPIVYDGNNDWICFLAEYTAGAGATYAVAVTNSRGLTTAAKSNLATAVPAVAQGKDGLIFGGFFNDLGTGTWATHLVNGSATGVVERGDVQRATGTLSASCHDKYEPGLAASYTNSATSTAGTGGAMIAIFYALQPKSADDAFALSDDAFVQAYAYGVDDAVLTDADGEVTVSALDTETAVLAEAAAVEVAAADTDAFALTEQAEVTVFHEATDAFTLAGETATMTETTGVSTEQAGSDSAVLSDNASVTVAAAADETFNLADNAAVTVAAADNDAAVLTDVASVTAAATGSDPFALADDAQVAVTAEGTETFAVSETASIVGTSADTDAFALTEAAGVSGFSADTEAFAVSEAAQVTVATEATDEWVFDDQAEMLVLAEGTDEYSLLDEAVATVEALGLEEFTFGEEAVVLVLRANEGDSNIAFVVASETNTSGRRLVASETGIRTAVASEVTS